jgi:hypothetical protein
MIEHLRRPKAKVLPLPVRREPKDDWENAPLMAQLNHHRRYIDSGHLGIYAGGGLWDFGDDLVSVSAEGSGCVD